MMHVSGRFILPVLLVLAASVAYCRDAATTQQQDQTPAEPTASPLPDQLHKQHQQRLQAERLIEQLTTADPEELPRVAERIYLCGEHAVVPLKLAELSDNFELRRRAQSISRKLRWRLAASEQLLSDHPDLVETMSGEDRPDRLAMVDAVAERAQPHSLNFLIECLADNEVYIRQRAVDAMVEIVRAGDDTLIKRRVREALEHLLDDNDENTRLLAVNAMTKARIAPIVRLSKMLDDPSLETRATVIRAMGYSSNTYAVRYILPLLEDPEWRVRTAVLEALADLTRSQPSSDAVAGVAARLDDPESYVRDMSAQLLGRWEAGDHGEEILQKTLEGEISDQAGFKALAAMNHGDGKAALLTRYDEADSAARKAEVLSVLVAYDGGDIDRLIGEALEDETMSSHWAELIPVAAQRSNWKRHFDSIAEKLLHEDPAVADAAWEHVRYRANEVPLPDGLRRRLLESPEPRHVCRALLAESSWSEKLPVASLRAGLRHADPEAKSQALGLIGWWLIDDPLETERPRYNRRRSGADDAPAKLPSALAADIRRCLNDEDLNTRLRAVALLNRLEGEKAQNLLETVTAGLSAEDPASRNLALAAIKDDALPFLDRMDLEALVADESTASRALDVIAAQQVTNYTEMLIDLGEKPPRNDKLMGLLVRTGDPRAMRIVNLAFEDRHDYEIIRFAEAHLRSRPGPEVVAFMRTAYDRFAGKDSYYLDSLVDVLITLPDPSAEQLMKDILEDARNADEDDWTMNRIAGKVTARLAQISPAEHREAMVEVLSGDDWQARQSILNALSEMEPTAETAELLIYLGSELGDDLRDSEFRGIVLRLPDEALREEFLPVISELPPVMQSAMFIWIGENLGAEDVETIASVPAEGLFVPHYLAALVGSLTHGLEDTLPTLDALDDIALARFLLATGDRGDAREVLAPYLHDERPKIASAARQGLAYHLLGWGAEKLSDSELQALVTEAIGEDAIGSYLAAEAIGLVEPAVLRQMDPTTLRGSSAVARGILARADDLDPQMLSTLNRYLSGTSGGPTARRLAVEAAIRSQADGLRPRYQQLQLHQMELTKRLVELVRALDDPQAIPHLMISTDFLLHHPDYQELLDKIRAAADDNPRLLGLLARKELIDEPTDEQFRQLVLNARHFIFAEDESSRHYSPHQDVRLAGTPAAELLNTAMAWAPDEPDADIVKAVSPRGLKGVTAAAVAWLKWDDPDAENVVIEAATRTTRPDQPMPPEQQVALCALSLGVTPEHAQPLTDLRNSIDADAWALQEFRWRLLGLIGRSDPAKAVELVAAAREERSRIWDSSGLEIALPLALMDETREQVQFHTGEAPEFLRRLYESVRAGRTTDMLPPWTSPEAAIETPEQAREQLGEAIRRWQAMPSELENDSSVRYSKFHAGIPRQMEVHRPATRDMLRMRSMAAMPPERFYGEIPQDSLSAAAVYLEPGEIAEMLQALTESDSPLAHRQAYRYAAAMRVTPLAERLRALIAGGDEDSVEIAWALASLEDEAAADEIYRLYSETTDPTDRIRLACLLHMLGRDDASETIEKAVALRAVRKFRMVFVDMVAEHWGARMDSRRILPFEEALQLAVPELCERSDARFDVWRADTWPGSAKLRAASSDLSDLRISSAGLEASGVTGNVLPLEPLIGHFPGEPPPFAMLCALEQDLEPHFFVQFADVAENPVDLLRHWNRWWQDNKHKPADDWYRQGLEQAIGELTHAKWWHRCRAGRRLMRLTGRDVDLPDAFDTSGWQELQRQWQQWARDHGSDGRFAALFDRAVEQGVLEPDAKPEPSDPDASLAALVHIAGRAPQPLAEAALLQLEAFGADPLDMTRAALDWQSCPRPSLASWARRRAEMFTDRRRLLYRSEHIAPPTETAPATRPATAPAGQTD